MRSLGQIRAAFLLLLVASCAVLEAQESTAPMEKGEQEALYSAIQGFVGRAWNGSEMYPDPCGWTPIQGISCDLLDGLWRITSLNIGPVMDNSLGCAPDADFTTHLFALKHLKSLSIYNCFSDPARHAIVIPSKDWVGLSGSLETLELRSNQGLTGELPIGLVRLLRLQSLVMTENRLAGELPPELGDLIRLRRLVLSGNQFSGEIPPSIGQKMTDLLILDLSRNGLTGPLPPALGGLRSLLKLDLSNNSLDGELPWELGELRNLTLLDLRDNNLTGGLSKSLQEMSSLQELLLSDNPLGCSIAGFPWEKMRNLATLGLSNTALRGGIPDSIAGLRGLKFLALDNNQLLGAVPARFQALPDVGAIYLNGNNLTGRLEFSEGFYARMGSRFAAWGNPNLCYNAAEVLNTGHAPVGVRQCKGDLVPAGASNSGLAAAGGGVTDQNPAGRVDSSGAGAATAAAEDMPPWRPLLLVLLPSVIMIV